MPLTDGWGGASMWAELSLVGLGSSDTGDVGGEEVDAMAVEVASGAVVVLGGAGIGVPGEDLGEVGRARRSLAAVSSSHDTSGLAADCALPTGSTPDAGRSRERRAGWRAKGSWSPPSAGQGTAILRIMPELVSERAATSRADPTAVRQRVAASGSAPGAAEGQWPAQASPVAGVVDGAVLTAVAGGLEHAAVTVPEGHGRR